MLKAAYMYKTTGGGDRFHVCGQCEYFAQPDPKEKIFVCIQHPERPDWRADWMACKGGKFPDAVQDAREQQPEPEAKPAEEAAGEGTDGHQIDIYEWLQAEGME